MTMKSHKTLQKGFRRTGNPDLVNDIGLYLYSGIAIGYSLGIFPEYLLVHTYYSIDDKSDINYIREIIKFEWISQ